MAVSCPVDLNTKALRDEISSTYARVAHEPDGSFHIHRGPAYAAGFLGYDAAELTLLPDEAQHPSRGSAIPWQQARFSREKRYWISVAVPGPICCSPL
jgi:hypothetical protein